MEPFAGSAAYSCRWLTSLDEVVLIDADPAVITAWQSILDFAAGRLPLDSVCPPVSEGERTSHPLHLFASVTWNTARRTMVATPLLARNVRTFRRTLPTMAKRLRDVDVRLILGSYQDAPRCDDSTYFIDPPYQGDPGVGYRFGSRLLDYEALGDWCRSLPGQVIVCEAAGADWLPFVPVGQVRASAGKVAGEVVWLNGNAADHGRLFL